MPVCWTGSFRPVRHPTFLSYACVVKAASDATTAPPPLAPCRQKPSNLPEFNRSALELCGAANNTEGYGNPRAWGWASAGCNTQQPFMCKMQGALAVRYTSNVTNSTYVWNTGLSTFDEAEETCNSYGGHLVSWNNADEQQEVEVGGVLQWFTVASFLPLCSSSAVQPSAAE